MHGDLVRMALQCALFLGLSVLKEISMSSQKHH